MKEDNDSIDERKEIERMAIGKEKMAENCCYNDDWGIIGGWQKKKLEKKGNQNKSKRKSEKIEKKENIKEGVSRKI